MFFEEQNLGSYPVMMYFINYKPLQESEPHRDFDEAKYSEMLTHEGGPSWLYVGNISTGQVKGRFQVNNREG